MLLSPWTFGMSVISSSVTSERSSSGEFPEGAPPSSRQPHCSFALQLSEYLPNEVRANGSRLLTEFRQSESACLCEDRFADQFAPGRSQAG